MMNEEYLKHVYGCYPDAFGNYPCDNGAVCDACMINVPKRKEVSLTLKHPIKGYVFSRCPVCGRTCRVLVTFPGWNKPFNPTTHVCSCGAEVLVSDRYKYDVNGYILND